MAGAITFRAAGAWNFTANNVPASPTLSPGAPTGVQVGDFLLLVSESRSITATASNPSGWTPVTGSPFRSGTASGGTIYVWTRIADGSGSDTPSVSWSGLTSGTSGDATGAGILAWSGVTNPNMILDVAAAKSDLSAQTTTSTIPALTTSCANSLVIGIAMKLLESSGQTSTVSGRTERADNSTTSGTGHIVEICDVIKSPAGATSATTVTWSATTSARALAVSIAIPAIAPLDTGLTITDFISHSFNKTASDTGLSISDSIAKINQVIITDTGLFVADFNPNGPYSAYTFFAGFGSFTSNQQRAIPVTGVAGTLVNVVLAAGKSGTPTDNFVVEFQSDSAGTPSGTVLASASVAGSTLITGSYAQTTFTLSAANPLIASNTYWIVVHRSGALNASNFYTIYAPDSGAVIGSRVYNGTTWSDPGILFFFQVNFIGDSIARVKPITLSDNGLTQSVVTINGDVITDDVTGTIRRSQSLQGDGIASPDSSFGLWRGTTNLVTNGGFETNTTHWRTAQGTETISRITTDSKFGSACLSVITPGSMAQEGAQIGDFSIPVSPSTTYTASIWVKSPVGSHLTFEFDDDISLASKVNFTGTGSWQRITNTATTTGSAANAFINIITDFGFSPQAITFYVDGVQLEQQPYATPYVETNGATASRNNGYITAPAGVLNAIQSWIAVRLRPEWASTSSSNHVPITFFNSADTSNAYKLQGDGGTSRWYAIIQDAIHGTVNKFVSQTHSAGDSITLIIAWTASNLYISLNGAAFQSVAVGSIAPVGLDTFRIGVDSGQTYASDSEYLWAATGTGTLSDTDAATIHAFGNTDPGGLPGNATFVWPAQTTAYALDSISFSKTGPVQRTATDNAFSGFPNTPVIDTFPYSTPGSLATLDSAHWTNIGTSLSLRVADVTPNTVDANGGNPAASFRSDQTYGPDCEAYVDFVALDTGTAGRPFKVIARGSNLTVQASKTNYQVKYDPQLQQFSIEYVASGTTNVIAGPVTQAAIAGDKLGIKCVGSDIQCWWYDSSVQQWKLVTHVTDTNLSSAGNIGLQIAGSVNVGDNFAGGTSGTFGLDSIIVQKTLGGSTQRTASDTGLIISDSVVSVRNRIFAVTGLTVTDLLAIFRNRALVDTGLTNSSTLVSLRNRVFADTGLTNTDALVTLRTHSLSDTGITNTDSIVNNRNRFFADTALTNSDSISETAIHNRTITDTGLTESDSLIHAAIRSDSDTGLNLSDTLKKFATHFISDTGLTITDTQASNRNRALTDTGLINTDSIARSSVHNISITATGLSLSDSLLRNIAYVLTDNGLSESDTAQKFATHFITDTGLTLTDTLALAKIKSDSDTGLTLTESLQKSAFKNIADTAFTLSDNLASNRSHSLSDAGLTESDSIARVNNTSRSITDTGLIVTDNATSLRLHKLTDTGLTESDSIAESSIHNRSISDAGLTESDTLVHAAIRSDSDTGLNLSDSTKKSVSKSISDTGSTLTDSAISNRNRSVNDTGISVADSITRTASHNISISDTGLSVSDSTASIRNRSIANTGLTISDSIVSTARHNIALSDTGITLSDILVHLVNRLDSDTGLSISDTTRKSASKSISDIGVSIFDSITTNGAISVIDTITITDSTRKLVTHFISDTGLTNTDSISKFEIRAISITDTGLTLIDSTQKSTFKSLSDTGLTISDTLAPRITHTDSDTAITISDTLIKYATHFVSDTGLANTDSIVISSAGRINISDTGLTNIDSITETAAHFRNVSDTGLTLSDSITNIRSRFVSDTALVISDSIRKSASKSLTDIGLIISDSAVPQVSRVDSDTAVTISDSLNKKAIHFVSDTGLTLTDSATVSGSNHIFDTGLTVSDSIRKSISRSASDTGLTLSDSINKLRISIASLTDTGLSESDSIQKSATHFVADTISITDSLQHHSYKIDSDTGLTIGDNIARAKLIFPSDTALTLIDSTAKTVSKFISNNGIAISDSISLAGQHNIAITDGGLTLSDSVASFKSGASIPLIDAGLILTDSIQKYKLASITDSIGISDSIAINFRPLIIRGFYDVTLRRDGYYRSYVTRWRT